MNTYLNKVLFLLLISLAFQAQAEITSIDFEKLKADTTLARAYHCKDKLQNQTLVSTLTLQTFCSSPIYFGLEEEVCQDWYRSILLPLQAYSGFKSITGARGLLAKHKDSISQKITFQIASRGHDIYREQYIEKGHKKIMTAGQTRGEIEKDILTKAKDPILIEVGRGTQALKEAKARLDHLQKNNPKNQPIFVLRSKNQTPVNFNHQTNLNARFDIISFNLKELEVLGAEKAVAANTLQYGKFIEFLNKELSSSRKINLEKDMPRLLHTWHEIHRENHYKPLRNSIGPAAYDFMLKHREDILANGKKANAFSGKEGFLSVYEKHSKELAKAMTFDVPFERLTDITNDPQRKADAENLKKYTADNVRFVTDSYRTFVARLFGIKTAIVYQALTGVDKQTRHMAQKIVAHHVAFGAATLGLVFWPYLEVGAKKIKRTILQCDDTNSPEDLYINHDGSCEKKPLKVLGPKNFEFFGLPADKQSELLKNHPRICQHYNDLAENYLQRGSQQLSIASEFKDFSLSQHNQNFTLMSENGEESLTYKTDPQGKLEYLHIQFTKSARAPQFTFQRDYLTNLTTKDGDQLTFNLTFTIDGEKHTYFHPEIYAIYHGVYDFGEPDFVTDFLKSKVHGTVDHFSPLLDNLLNKYSATYKNMGHQSIPERNYLILKSAIDIFMSLNKIVFIKKNPPAKTNQTSTL